MLENLDFVVKRPREDVFRGLTDMEAMARFAEDPRSPMKVSVTPVPERPKTGVGSAVTIAIQGAGQSMLMETVEWDSPTRCVRTLESPDLSAKVTFDFSDAPEGTHVRVELALEAKSFLFKMMLPVLAKRLASEKLALAEKMKDGVG
ncbi:MAG: SRPBCC family protein [Elusimicrobia bacterium]|nr:SRPBCC family protein [Elusimicrobiota bacterium]